MIDKINACIARGVENEAYPGCNYALIQKDEVIFNSFGSRSLFPKVEKNTLSTIYDLASLTKVICTTTLLLILIDQKKISLDDKVAKYLKDFQLKDITIRDLTSHQGGIAADVGGSWTLSKEEIRKNIMEMPYTYLKNSKVVYSDLGYITLGYVIEEIEKESLDKLFHKLVALKLGMKNTTFNPKNKELCAPTEVRGGVITKGYVHDEKSFHMNGVAGHAGLFSTVSDLAIFVKMILNGGIYEGKRIINEATLNNIFIPQIKADVTRTVGWILDENTGSIYHTGFTGTYIIINKEMQVGFVMLTNRVHPTRENHKIFDYRKELKEILKL